MMNNSTYKLLTQQLHDKDQKMIDQVKEIQTGAQRVDLLEREVADLNKQVEFYTKKYNKLYQDLCNLYHNAT